MAPDTSGLGLHGGGAPWDPAQYYVHRGGRMYNGLTTVTWSLGDSDSGQGGFGCIPGSHKAAERLPEGVPAEWVKEIPVPAGSVLIFTEALTHCTLPWQSRYDCRAVLYKYAPGHPKRSTWPRSRPAGPRRTPRSPRPTAGRNPPDRPAGGPTASRRS